MTMSRPHDEKLSLNIQYLRVVTAESNADRFRGRANVSG